MQQGVPDSAGDGERARIAFSCGEPRLDTRLGDPALHRLAAKWISLQSQPARLPATEYQPAGPAISIGGGVPLGAIGLAEGLLALEPGESAAGLSGGLAMAISGLAPAPRPVDGFCLSGSPNALRGLVSPVNLAWSYEAAASLPRPAMQAALGVA